MYMQLRRQDVSIVGDRVKQSGHSESVLIAHSILAALCETLDCDAMPFCLCQALMKREMSG
jgi:hypothetical protein